MNFELLLTTVVFVLAVLAIFVVVALPPLRDAFSSRSTLELLITTVLIASGFVWNSKKHTSFRRKRDWYQGYPKTNISYKCTWKYVNKKLYNFLVDFYRIRSTNSVAFCRNPLKFASRKLQLRMLCVKRTFAIFLFSSVKKASKQDFLSLVGFFVLLSVMTLTSDRRWHWQPESFMKYQHSFVKLWK